MTYKWTILGIYEKPGSKERLRVAMPISRKEAEWEIESNKLLLKCYLEQITGFSCNPIYFVKANITSIEIEKEIESKSKGPR